MAESGEAWACGDNSCGQLGDGTFERRLRFHWRMQTVIQEMFEGAKQATRATRATRAEERRCIYPQRFVGFADSELKNVAGVVRRGSLQVVIQVGRCPVVQNRTSKASCAPTDVPQQLVVGLLVLVLCLFRNICCEVRQKESKK